MGGWVRTVEVDAVAEGETREFRHGHLALLLCQHEGALFALENRCSHAAAPLHCGRMRHGWIACPAHGARFDLASGEALSPPASTPVRTFPLRVEAGWIEVAVPAADPAT